MPIYEYRCSACGHELESLQKFSDAPLTLCPACKADTLVKQLSAAGFQLKGSGWYVTDFKGGSAKPSAPKTDGENKADAKSGDKADSKAESGSTQKSETSEGRSESKSEGKSESKSEGKSESKSDSKGGGPAPSSGSGASSASS